MVSAAAAVAVEIPFFNPEGDQVFPGWGVGLEGSCGRDVVGCDRIAKKRERAHPFQLFSLGQLRRKSLEERRALDVGAFRIPRILGALFSPRFFSTLDCRRGHGHIAS